MIKTAVILAAGLGSRIRERTGEHPKGFLKLDNKPIIEISIENLLDVGIDKIIIGTGYRSEEYESLALKYSQIQCVFNPLYDSSGSLLTLYQLKDDIKDDFLLLESDLVYEKKALKTLIDNKFPDVILASELTHTGDEVFIELDEKRHLVNMSKERDQLNQIAAELVGISKLSCATYQMMCSAVTPFFQTEQDMHYEEGLIEIAKTNKLYVHKLPDLVWCEVDDEYHWHRAVSIVYPMIKAREHVTKPIKRNILLNPGPATTSDSVKFAQVVPDICPREEEFGELMEFISLELTKFVASPEEYTTMLFSGSGTAAVESMLSSVVNQDVILIVNNGAYGKRMCQIADIYGLNYLEYKSALDEPFEVKHLEAFIRATSKRVSFLAMVHCETTTGLLNDLEAVGELCKRRQITLLVDAMSSYGAIPISMEKMNIHYLAGSSNKCLQGIAGVSFVVANKFHLEKTKRIKPRNLYLNLYQQFLSFLETKQMRFTPPVQALYALKQAILETKWEGIENRYHRYSKSWETLIAGISRLGLRHLIPNRAHSKIITTIIEPVIPNYNFKEMHDYFLENGMTIYPGKLATKNTFRVANIGKITYVDMERFTTLLEQYLNGLKKG